MAIGRDTDIELVFRRLHPRLWRGLLAFTGSAEVASDAEAEAFTQAIARGDAIRDPEPWIWTAAFRISSGMLAKRSKMVDSFVPAEPLRDQPVIERIREAVTGRARCVTPEPNHVNAVASAGTRTSNETAMRTGTGA